MMGKMITFSDFILYNGFWRESVDTVIMPILCNIQPIILQRKLHFFFHIINTFCNLAHLSLQ